jgi:uncharacterized protein (TIGR02145 family)
MMKNTILLLAMLVFSIVKNQAQTVTDYDGNVYDTVNIGTQVWMKQNLKVTHYNNGVEIPNITDFSIWKTLTTGARCYYNNDSATNDSVYGVLYNWYAVNSDNHICPTDWHVSTSAEWLSAEEFLGGNAVAGGKMKEAGTLHWKSPNTGATNSSRFTGLPGGMRDPVNDFRVIKENGLWWTATNYNNSLAIGLYMWYLFTGIDYNQVNKKYGVSVRCIKDVETNLGEMNKLDKIKLYPNPADTKVIIENPYSQLLEIQLYNTLGDCILQTKMGDVYNEIDLSFLANGMYAVRISTKDKTTMKSLMKQ